MDFGGEMILSDGIPGIEYEIINISGQYRNRLAELGFNPGCMIKITNKNITGMMVINCRNSAIALRKEEAECVHIADILTSLV